MEITNFETRLRTILGVDDVDLPDEVISHPEYKELAESFIKSRVGDWESFYEESEDENIQKERSHKKNIFEMCVIYKTADLLIPFCQTCIGNIKVAKTTHESTEYFENNFQIKALSIRDSLYELLDMLCDAPYDSFIGFALSGK